MPCVRACLIFTLAAALSPAQDQQPQPGGQPGGGGISTPSPGGANIPGQPGRFPDSGRQDRFPQDPRQQFPDAQRPIFLSGKVMMEDGAPPPDSVTIERVCHGIARPEAYTDSKGRFSFQLGQNMGMMQDASVGSDLNSGFPSSPGGMGGRGSAGGMGGPAGMGGRGISERDLMGCELRAALPGYRSEAVNLAGRRVMDNPDVGTIVLRPIAGVQGFTHSATTLLAPKDARKAFDKGRDQLKKRRNADAQKEFEKAVQLYPKFALAWHELGSLYREQNEDARAMDAFSKALEADSKLVSPYLQIAQLYAKENKWQDVADTTDRVTRLDPVSFPQAFFFNAVANYNLQKLDAAENSAREAVKLDANHRFPKAQHLLAILLAMKNDHAGAAENLRGYIRFAPQANDLDLARKQLSEIERALGKTESAQQPQP